MKKLFFYIYLALLSVLITDPYGTIAEHLVGEEIAEEFSLKEKETEEQKDIELDEEDEESLTSSRKFAVKGLEKIPTQTLYQYAKTLQSPYIASEQECLHALHEAYLC